ERIDKPRQQSGPGGDPRIRRLAIGREIRQPFLAQLSRLRDRRTCSTVCNGTASISGLPKIRQKRLARRRLRAGSNGEHNQCTQKPPMAQRLVPPTTTRLGTPDTATRHRSVADTPRPLHEHYGVAMGESIEISGGQWVRSVFTLSA